MLITRPSFSRWNQNVTCVWGVTSSIDKVIRQLEIGRVELLPDLHSAHSIIMTSDYGGQHKQAVYESFSFLIADLGRCARWDEERLAVRAEFFRDNRRMSYKALNDRKKQRALLPFLAAANLIPGLLATVLVRKEFKDSLRPTPDERLQIPSAFSTWPSQTLTKMAFVSHLGALFVAGLSASGQNVVWLSDNDDFLANDQRVIDLTPIIAGIMSGYVGHGLGHFRLGTMKCDAGDLLIEDLTSIPDLVSGAASEIPLRGTLRSQSRVLVPLRDHLSPKALTVLNWMGQEGTDLKRLLLTVDFGDKPSTIKVKALELYPE